MKIGEFFIQIAVKGGKHAGEAIKGVRGNMQDLENSSLTTKAAILGVMYGLERMMSASSEAGMALQQFANYTGISTDLLQRYQYAGRQVGVTNEEVAGSFKAVQSAMTNMLAGHGAPAGMEQLGRILGQHGTGFDMNRVRDTEYMMKKLQEFAVLTKNSPDIRNMVLGSFGLGENMIGAMGVNSFNDQVMSRAPVRSKGQIKALANVNAQWANLGDKISRAFDSFNIKHGGEIVKNLIEITDKVTKLADSLTTLAEKLKVFKLIGKAFEGWGMIFNEANSMVDHINKKGVADYVSSTIEDRKYFLKGVMLELGEQMSRATGKKMNEDQIREIWKRGQEIQTREYNQTNHFNIQGSGNPKETAHETQKMLNRTYRQMGQGVVD